MCRNSSHCLKLSHLKLREAKRYPSRTQCSSAVHVEVILQAKQRKIRDKYGDQDEEERQMRMDILAVSHCGLYVYCMYCL